MKFLPPIIFLIANVAAYMPTMRQWASPWGTSVTSASSKRLTSSSLSMSAKNYNTFVRVKSNFEAQTSMENDQGFGLKEYMRLPVEQYVCIKMPLDADLTREKDDLFVLTVPPVTFFNLEVSPTVYCKVYQTSDAVVIESDRVELGGSPYVKGLNGCFKIKIETIFNWIDRIDYKAILSRSKIDVDVDPPPPFKFFGKRVLETTGNLAMTIALRTIENAFVTNLGNDYARWAVDSGYRDTRADGACEVPSDVLGSSGERGGELDGHCSGEWEGRGRGEGEGIETPREGDDDTGRARAPSSPPNDIISDVPTVSKAERIAFPETLPAPPTVPVALRDIPVRLTEAEEEEKKRREAQALSRNLNTGLADPNPGIMLPFQPPPVDDSPAALLDDVCLVPGEPIVRVEEAPDNSRRIFTGIDITANIDDVWGVLTDYENLGNVIPSLVKNEVLTRTRKGGARLAQVGGAKVLPGVTFTAKTVLDVEVYLEDNPIPDELTADHLPDAPSSTSSSQVMRDFDKLLPVQRGVFPRPYAITQLKHRDITMQNVEGRGDFEHYQGIWRLQSLPNCAPDGGDACRLTYAVEIKPKGFLPVGLIEGRIASDLKNNLDAIRMYVEKSAKRTVPENYAIATPVEMAGVECTDMEDVEVAVMAAEKVAGLSAPEELPGDDRVELESVISAIKLAQIEEVARVHYGGGEPGAEVFGDPEEEEDGQGAIEVLGDEISPKKWSYRRLLVTGSGYAPEATLSRAKENRALSKRIAALEAEIARKEEILGLLEEIVPASYQPSFNGSEGRLSTIVTQLRRVRGEPTESSGAESTPDEGESGDIISPKRWSFRRLWVTGSGYVGKAKPSITKVNQALKARAAHLEMQLQTRSDMLTMITEIATVPARSE